MSHTVRPLLRRPTWVVTGCLELKACQAHVAPAVLPPYTSAALHLPALCLHNGRLATPTALDHVHRTCV